MIEKIIVLSLISIAISCTTWEDMIFSKPATWVETKLPEYITKPLFGCYICATFWWGGLSAYILGWDIWLCIPSMGFSAAISLMSKE